MKVGPTKDRKVIEFLCQNAEEQLPPFEEWIDREDITVLVAFDENGPHMACLVLDCGETGQPEVHLAAPMPFCGAEMACEGFRQWIRQYKTWDQVWSYTSASDPRTLTFAKHLGFEHAFDEGERNFIVINLNK